MNRFNFNQNKSSVKTLLLTGLFGLSSLTAELSAKEFSVAESNITEQPNIIYILADDMGLGDTSSFNPQGKISTPNLERLASAGIKFTNVHTSSSVCTPTRYGILTGRYSWRSTMKQGVTQGHSPHLINPERETVASLLKAQGYDTAMVGKWHLGMDWASTDGKKLSKTGENVDFKQAIKNGPNANGFDYYYGISASLNMNPHVFIENDRALGDLVFLKDSKAVKKAGLTGAKPGWMAKGFTQDQVQTTFINKTISWIEQQQKSRVKKPFFVYLPLNSPHSPIVPSKDFIGKSGLSAHGDFTMEMDHEIGRLLTALDDMQLSDNTLVIFTADNGVSPRAGLDKMQQKGHFSSMAYRGLKGSLFEGGHRVPFIARWPGKIKANTETDFHASTVDLMATLADIIDVKLADNSAEDSVSMKPALFGQPANSAKRGVVYHSDSGFYSIRQGDWKLILHKDGGSRRHNPKDQNNPVKDISDLQLFNMVDDPTERVNVQAQHQEKVSDLLELLAQHIQRGRSTEGKIQLNDAVSEKTEKKWLMKAMPRGSNP